MKELKEISKEENRSVSGVIREAMEKYVRQKDDQKESYLL